MDTEVIYSGIGRRIVACIVDSILLFVMVLILGGVVFLAADVQRSDDFSISIIGIILTLTVCSFYLIFNTLMLVKFSCTPGLFLFGMRVKDRNTLGKVTIMQAITRVICFWVIHLICDTLKEYNGLLSILLPILILILAVRDERKQALHDKIANTVVISCKPR